MMPFKSRTIAYMKNVGRSLGYATLDVVKDNTPFLNSLFKESKETVKEIYTSIKDFSSGKGTDVKSMGKEVISTAWGNLKDDLKTGNWYNKERDEVLNNEMMKMMGFDIEDMGFSFDADSFEFGSDTDDISDGEELIVKQNAKNTAATIMAVDKVGAKVATSINRGTIESANFIVNSNRAMNQAMMTINTRGFATVTEAIATLNKNTLSMNEALAQPLNTFMKNGTLFFTKTTESLDKIVKLGEEILNRLPKPQTNNRPTGKKSFTDLVGSEGFSVSAYKDLVAGNIKDMTSMYTSILGMFGLGGGKGSPASLVKGFSPLRMVTRKFMQSIIPVTLTGALKAFDTGLKEFLPSLLAREMGKGTQSKSFLGSLLRSILLPKNTLRRDVGTQYNQGPIPFDGQTKKAITEVIPDYLAHILSALNGSEPTKYDYKGGRYVKRSEITNIKTTRERQYAEAAGGKFRTDALAAAKGSRNPAQIEKEIEEYFRTVFLTGEGFDINRRGFSTSKVGRALSPEAIRILRRLVRTGKYNSMPGDVMIQRANMSKLVEELGLSGTSLESSLFDNSGYLKGSKMGKAIGAVDKYGNSSLDYLRGIYSNTLNGFNGGGSGSSRRGNIRGVDLPKFNNLDSGSNRNRRNSHTSRIPTNRDSVNRDDAAQVEAWNLKIDNEVKAMARKLSDLKKKQKRGAGDYSSQIRELEDKINKTKENGYIDTNAELRSEAILRGEDVSRYFEDKSEKTGQFIRNALKKHLPEQVIDFFNKPIDAVTKLLNSLTSSMTTFLWGDGTKDGIFEQVRKKITAAIEKNETMSKFLDTVFGVKDENGHREFWNNTKAGLKEYWTFMKSGLGMKVSNAELYPYGNDSTDILRGFTDSHEAANGRKVTRDGMVSVSRGEMIIPAELNPYYKSKINKRIQHRNEANAVRRFYGAFKNGTARVDEALDFNALMNDETSSGRTTNASSTETNKGIKAGVINELGNVMDFLGGGITPETKKAFNTFIQSVGKEFKGENGKILRGRLGAGGIIGAGMGGLLGAPILGLLVGSAAGFVSKSQSAQKFLFGDFEVDENGNPTDIRKGGLFGKSTANFLEKVAPEMARGGSIGLLGGSLLIGGPLGMVGGLVVGTAVGFAKKSGKAQEFLFGKFDDKGNLIKKGLFDKDKVNKIMPKAIVGAGLGLLLGPAGVLSGGVFTNMVLGAGLGLISSSNKVHEFLFGDGQKKRGLLNKVRDRLFGGIHDLFFNTINHAKVTIENIGKNIITKVGNIKDWFVRRRARKTAEGKVTKTTREKIIDAIGGAFGKVGGGVLKGLVSAPFLPFMIPRLMADSRMRKNARRGYNIYDRKLGRNMTAEERTNWRQDNILRRGLTSEVGPAGRRWDRFDSALAEARKSNPNSLTELQADLDLLDENSRAYKQVKYRSTDELYEAADSNINTSQLNEFAKLASSGASDEDIASMVEGIIPTASDEIKQKYIEAIKAGAKRVRDVKEKRETAKSKLKQFGFTQFGRKDISRAQELVKNEISSLTPEEKTDHFQEEMLKLEEERKQRETDIHDSIVKIANGDATISVVLNSGVDESLQTQGSSGSSKNSKKKRKKKKGKSGETALNNINSEDSSEEPQEGDTHIEFHEGQAIEYIYSKANGWQPNIRDKETAKEVEQENAADEAMIQTPGILGKLANGFNNFKNKLFGGNEDGEKLSIWDKIKLFGKSILTGIGVFAGIKALPKLWPTIQKVGSWILEHGANFITNTLPNLITGLVDVVGLVASGIGKVLGVTGKIAKHFFPDDISIDQDAETFGTDAEIVEDRVNSTIKSTAVLGGLSVATIKGVKIAASAGIKSAAAAAAASGGSLGASGTISAAATAATPVAVVGAGVVGAVVGSDANIAYHYQVGMIPEDSAYMTLTFSDGSSRICEAVAENSKKYFSKYGNLIFKWTEGSPYTNEDGFIPGVSETAKARPPYGLNYFSVKKNGDKNEFTFYQKRKDTFLTTGIDMIPYFTLYGEDLEYILHNQHKGPISDMLSSAMKAFTWGNSVSASSMHKRLDNAKQMLYLRDLANRKDKKTLSLSSGDVKADAEQWVVDNVRIYKGINIKADGTWSTTTASGSTTTTRVTEDGSITVGTHGKFGSGLPILNGRAGSGFVSQVDPKYANKAYGPFSIQQAGCGPAVAAMAASKFGKNLSMDSAMMQGKKYLSASGTDTAYFGDILGKSGISTNYVDSNTLINNLAQSKPAILLGQDSFNRSKANSPFGPNGHYVLAEGFDKNGNVIIDDPELSGPKAYNPAILNSLQTAISTGSGSGLAGKGSYNKTATTDQVYNWLISNGYSPAAAAGIMGNIQQETGFKYGSDSYDGRYPSIGLFQWEKYTGSDSTASSRAQELIKYAKSKGSTWQDLATQMEYFNYEMSTPEMAQWLNPKAAADQGIMKAARGDYTTKDGRYISKEEGLFSRSGLNFNTDGVTLSQFKSLTDPTLAAKYLHAAFERSGDTWGSSGMNRRISAAQEYFNLYGGNKKSVRYVQFDPPTGKYLVEYTDNTKEWMSSPPSSNEVNFSKNVLEGSKAVKCVSCTLDYSNNMYKIGWSDGTYSWSSTKVEIGTIKNSVKDSSEHTSTSYDNIEGYSYSNGSASSEDDGGNILTKVMNIIKSGFEQIFGSDGTTTTNSFGMPSSSGVTVVPDLVPNDSAKNKITNMMNYMTKIQNTETYSNALRNTTTNGMSYSDCSSLARQVYKKYLGVDIGSTTDVQWPNIANGKVDNVKVVDYNPGNYQAYMNNMQPGDLIYFYNKNYRGGKADNVSHVELYLGNGQVIGQNAAGPKLPGQSKGSGPSIKNLSSMTSKKYWTDGSPSGNTTSTASYHRYLGTARYSGSGSGLYGGSSNAYDKLIAGNTYVPNYNTSNRTIIVNNNKKNDYSLEQLVGAILDILRSMADMDSKDSILLNSIKSNSDNLSAINNFLSNYKDYKKAQIEANRNSGDVIDADFKATVTQLAAAAARG